jgi:hypothetical protein
MLILSAVRQTLGIKDHQVVKVSGDPENLLVAWSARKGECYSAWSTEDVVRFVTAFPNEPSSTCRRGISRSALAMRLPMSTPPENVPLSTDD